MCTDIDAYYACKFYKDADTEIIRCTAEEEFFSSLDVIIENSDKLFYFFGHCGKGYLKAEMGKIENIEKEFEGYAIPNSEDISIETHNPKEIKVVNPKRGYKFFSRLKKK